MKYNPSGNNLALFCADWNIEIDYDVVVSDVSCKSNNNNNDDDINNDNDDLEWQE